MLNLQGFAKTGNYLKVGDSYWLCIKESGLYEINGVRKDINVGWNSNTKQVVLSEEPVLRKVSRGARNLIHYENEGQIITPEEYRKVLWKYEDEDGERFYPSLEVEFEHRKELEGLNKFDPVYEQQEDTYEEVETRCVGDVVDTGSDYIENALSYGKATFSNSNFYKVDLSRINASELAKFVEEHNLKDRYENSSHSNVHYAKIGGNYAMTGLPFSKDKCFKYVTSLDDAKRLESDTRKQVRSVLNMKVLGGNHLLHGKTLVDVYDKIGQWVSTLGELDVKVKSDIKARGLRNSMSKVKKELEELLEKQL